MGALRAAVVPLRAAVIAAVLLLVTSTTYAFVALAQTTALIMGGTGHPLSTPPDTDSYVRRYMDQAVNNFISPASTVLASTGIPQGPYNAVAVITPEQDAPNYGSMPIDESIRQGLAALHSCLTSHNCDYNTGMGSVAPSPADTFVVFGYSQSATIAMLEKARLADEYEDGEGPDVSFVVIGASRPNGGLAQRDPKGIVTTLLFGRRLAEWITNPGPTDTQYSTVNIALQYDGFADFPLNPLNLLATVNAYLGIILLHTTYGEHSLSDPGVLDQGQYGDTRYYLIPADVVPLLKPLQSIPLIGPALADSWDPVLRVIIESAYDRSISPGVPTPFDIFYFENPIRFVASLLAAVPVGIDNGFESLFGVRPLGTQRPGPYGVDAWKTLPRDSNSTAHRTGSEEDTPVESDIPDDLRVNRTGAEENTQPSNASTDGGYDSSESDPVVAESGVEPGTISPSMTDAEDDAQDDIELIAELAESDSLSTDERDSASDAAVSSSTTVEKRFSTADSGDPDGDGRSETVDRGSAEAPDSGQDDAAQREQGEHQSAA